MTYEEYVKALDEIRNREKELSDRALELEKQATDLMRRDRDNERDRAETYKQMYEGLSKGPSVGCRILRFITGGIHRCNS